MKDAAGGLVRWLNQFTVEKQMNVHGAGSEVAKILYLQRYKVTKV